MLIFLGTIFSQVRWQREIFVSLFAPFFALRSQICMAFLDRFELRIELLFHSVAFFKDRIGVSRRIEAGEITLSNECFFHDKSLLLSPPGMKS